MLNNCSLLFFYKYPGAYVCVCLVSMVNVFGEDGWLVDANGGNSIEKKKVVMGKTAVILHNIFNMLYHVGW